MEGHAVRAARASALTCALCLLCLKLSTAQVVGPELDPAANEEMRAKIQAGAPLNQKLIDIDNATTGELAAAYVPVPRARNLAVCGVNDAYRSSFRNACKLIMYARSGKIFVCSAWVITKQHVATAGHCLIDDVGSWFTAIDVFCGGGEVGLKTPPTRRAARFVTTIEYHKYAFGRATRSSMWADAGVIKLNAPLGPAYTPHKYGDQPACSGRRGATLSGYPADTKGRCPAGFTGRVQWSAQGQLGCKVDSFGFLHADLDGCGGHSGSRILRDGKVVAIFVAESTKKGVCMNYATRIKDGGNGQGRGVNMRKMINALP